MAKEKSSLRRISDYLVRVTPVLPLFLLVFLLQSCEKEKKPVVPLNNSPKIVSLSKKPEKVLTNSIVELTCIAEDEDRDKLTISWSSKRGRFLSGNFGNSVKWFSPSTPGKDTIVVHVSDEKATTKGFLIIEIGYIPSIPILLIPKNEATEIVLEPFLEWKASRYANSYQLQISSNPNFKDSVTNKRGIVRTSTKLEGLKINSVYYWRVRSKNNFGVSNWSEIFSFRTVVPPAAPVLLSPFNSASEVAISTTLTWQSIWNAKTYTVQIAIDKNFTSLLYEKSSLTNPYFEAANLNYFTGYHWRVKASNDYGTSDWSHAFALSTIGTLPSVVPLLNPLNCSNNNPITLQLTWNPVNHVDEYLLQVAEDSLFAKIIFDKKGITINKQQVSGLQNYVKYYWRISSGNKYGTSSWSDVWNFTTRLAAPVITVPSGISTEMSIRPTLKWSATKGSESYSVQLSDDSTFASTIFSESGITDTSVEVTNLDYFKQYHWRISSENQLSNSDWSSVHTFKTTGFFYQARSYGHQAVYNPFFVFLNGGFDMIQVGNQRDIKKFPFKEGFKNIWKNFSAPFGPIGRYGWWNFLSDQVLPLSMNKESAQFWPNYNLHLIGGGMEFAALREWYEYYNYPIPDWLAAFTTMGYHFINEVVENGSRDGDDVDPIADFFIFDLGGVILFTSESVRRFFAEDLNLVDWSQQPSFSIRNGELHNNGQFFAVRWKFPFLKSWYAFYYFGTNGVGGLSYKFNDGTAISLGVGAAVSDLILLDERTNKKTIGMVGNAAIFYDKNNSLLASLSVTIKTDYMINLNIYPGVLKFGDISPGLWGAYSQDGNYIFGFTFSWLPFGFGYSTKISASRY